jgi:hypothetical protein
LKVTFRGKRVAFSIFGKISSLNGEPESGVVLKAKGVAPEGEKRIVVEKHFKFAVIADTEWLISLSSVLCILSTF